MPPPGRRLSCYIIWRLNSREYAANLARYRHFEPGASRMDSSGARSVAQVTHIRGLADVLSVPRSRLLRYFFHPPTRYW
ncbi:hypothetical protein PG994_006021 [Apiospora phragmitis]|uniref:Uncharacterized protein n=1 Tax=Apiospora phragmitis TaxID=2905665 RepID=A0ABR1VDW4_9PEZI